MARKPRIHLPGGLYHVILRGNDRREIFRESPDRHEFFRLLGDGIARFEYRVHAYCLMPNHVHLALQCGNLSLASGAQNLAFRYSRWFNRRYGHVGHLFQGRYKALLIDTDRYCLALIRYIHLNPVRAHIVADPVHYPWSSHAVYMGRASMPWLTTNWVLGLFGDEAVQALWSFAEFVAAGIDVRDGEEFGRGPHDSRILGDECFTERILGDSVNPRQHATLASLVDAVNAAYGISKEDLIAPGQRRIVSEARAIVALYSLKFDLATLTEVAGYFRRDVTTMSAVLRRLQERATTDRALEHRMRQVETYWAEVAI